MSQASIDRQPQGLSVRSPFDQREIGRLPWSTHDQIEQALARAQALFGQRRHWLPKAQRIEILRRAATQVAQRREALARQVALECGKPYQDALIEVDRGVDGLNSCVEVLRTEAGQVVPMGLNAGSAARLAFTQHEPIGVVLAISAFNHPFNLVVHQVGPAIAAGAPVLLKPSPKAPLSGLSLLQILQEAGLPEGWAQWLLPADNADVAALVADARIGFLSFVGSAQVGWALRSRLAPGARCALEHGGVAPVIVAADADLAMAASSLARGAFWHAGQACVSVQRVFCDRRVVAEFAERLAAEAARLVVGDPLDTQTQVGPLITVAEVERVAAWVQSACAGGARQLSGGQRLSASCYAPTVLLEPAAQAEVSRREVFGPVVCVYAYDALDTAIAQANALPYAFQAAVFSRSLDTSLHCWRQLDATAVMINDSTLFRVDWMPFAGARQSGLGVGGIRHSLREMQTEKMMLMRSQALLD